MPFIYEHYLSQNATSTPLPRDDSMGNRLYTSIPEDVTELFIYFGISFTMFSVK